MFEHKASRKISVCAKICHNIPQYFLIYLAHFQGSQFIISLEFDVH